jgi:hypothetical protein
MRSKLGRLIIVRKAVGISETTAKRGVKYVLEDGLSDALKTNGNPRSQSFVRDTNNVRL